MKIVAASEGAKQIALSFQNQLIDDKPLLPEGEIVVLDDMRNPGDEFKKSADILFSYHDLQRIGIDSVKDTLRRWKHCLKYKGQLHAFIPSIEWAAYQILTFPPPNPYWRRHLMGRQQTEEQLNLNAFTLLEWRELFDMAGLKVIVTRQGVYELDETQAEHHYLVAVK